MNHSDRAKSCNAAALESDETYTIDNGQASILELFQMRERITNVQNEALQAYLNSIEAQIELEGLIGKRLTEIKE